MSSEFADLNPIPKLPDGYTVRPPHREEAPALTEILAACELENTGKSGMTLKDFLGDWEGVDLDANARVILDPAGSPAAYADIDIRGDVVFSVYGFVHPSRRGVGLGAYLVAWGEARAHEAATAAPKEARIVTRHYVNERDASALALPNASGYATARITYTMAIDLSAPPGLPSWPEGLTPRAYQPEVDVTSTFEAYEEAFADAWGRAG